MYVEELTDDGDEKVEELADDGDVTVEESGVEYADDDAGELVGAEVE